MIKFFYLFELMLLSQDSLQELFLYFPCLSIYYNLTANYKEIALKLLKELNISAQKLWFLHELHPDSVQYKLIIKYSLKENQNQVFYRISRLSPYNSNDFIDIIAKYSMKYCTMENWKERLDFIFKLVEEKIAYASKIKFGEEAATNKKIIDTNKIACYAALNKNENTAWTIIKEMINFRNVDEFIEIAENAAQKGHVELIKYLVKINEGDEEEDYEEDNSEYHEIIYSTVLCKSYEIFLENY